MKVTKHVFATFPEFSELTLADREKWEDLIADYPPYSEFSFPSLMTWWNTLGSIRVSQLNGNLVISCWLPGDEKNSGLSLVGTKKIDETLCTIFDHLKSKGEKPRLVHVPEFVVNYIRFPEMFKCRGERAFDECVISIDNLIDPKQMKGFYNWRLRRFLSCVDEKDVTLRRLDLEDRANQQMLIDLYNEWKDRAPINNLNKYAEDEFLTTIKNCHAIGRENICLFINGQIHSYLLYYQPSDSEYVVITYGKFSFELPGVLEYSAHRYAQWFAKKGRKFANIDIDTGNLTYRTFQLTLGPTHFLRKYTIGPK